MRLPDVLKEAQLAKAGTLAGLFGKSSSVNSENYLLGTRNRTKIVLGTESVSAMVYGILIMFVLCYLNTLNAVKSRAIPTSWQRILFSRMFSIYHSSSGRLDPSMLDIVSTLGRGKSQRAGNDPDIFLVAFARYS